MGGAADTGLPAKPRRRGAVSLDAELLAAHAAGDVEALITLYTRASEEAVKDVAQGFYLTHAYVFALEAGDARAEGLAERLRVQGRL
ncbi:hypothetical protein SAMN05444273_102491 [Litoreibacter ascidiaceicola]|uniref:Uncharacterized protein n=1 Tax=Litoreibacter ascidiaceicola TaxID=1486859 RepID=A0A1M4W509_9RHOB|nr:hypothetical protein SAMN05444273_102491 [Litoreibacter ascidiaceicola]